MSDAGGPAPRVVHSASTEGDVSAVSDVQAQSATDPSTETTPAEEYDEQALPPRHRQAGIDRELASSPYLTARGVPMPAPRLGTLSRIVGAARARPILEALEKADQHRNQTLRLIARNANRR